MLACIPYHPDLPVDYAGLAKSIKKAGTNPNHTLLVISLRSNDERAYLFLDSLSDYFGRVMRKSIEEQPETGTMTANRFFSIAVAAFRKFKPAPNEAEHAPMLYWDPSYRPVTPRWLDDLQSDYFRCGAPKVFGNFRDSEPPVPIGPLAMSLEFVNTCALSQFLPHDAHWRNYLAWELLKNSVKAAGIGSHASAVLAPHFDV